LFTCQSAVFAYFVLLVLYLVLLSFKSHSSGNVKLYTNFDIQELFTKRGLTSLLATMGRIFCGEVWKWDEPPQGWLGMRTYMDEDVYPFLFSVVCKVIFTFGEASCAVIHVL